MKCAVCEKTVYPTEVIKADDKCYHKACFRCKQCNSTLNAGNFSALDGTIYCKPHFKQLFREKGRYDFGETSGEQAANKINAGAAALGKMGIAAAPAAATTTSPAAQKPAPAAAAAPAAAPAAAAAPAPAQQQQQQQQQQQHHEEPAHPAPAAKAPAAATPAAAAAAKKEPSTQLNNNKWIIEHYENKTDLVIEAETKQTIYIFKCKGSLVTVKGKCATICMDDCTKTGVIFDTAIAALELVNCKSVKAQCNENVPSIQIDNTQGATLFIPKTSLAAEIYSSKSTEININVPDDNEGDMIETPIPSQFISKLVGDEWKTDAVAHVGV